MYCYYIFIYEEQRYFEEHRGDSAKNLMRSIDCTILLLQLDKLSKDKFIKVLKENLEDTENLREVTTLKLDKYNIIILKALYKQTRFRGDIYIKLKFDINKVAGYALFLHATNSDDIIPFYGTSTKKAVNFFERQGTIIKLTKEQNSIKEIKKVIDEFPIGARNQRVSGDKNEDSDKEQDNNN